MKLDFFDRFSKKITNINFHATIHSPLNKYLALIPRGVNLICDLHVNTKI